MKKLFFVIALFIFNCSFCYANENIEFKYDLRMDLYTNHVSATPIYLIHPEVLQILDGGFLADTAPQENVNFNSIIYVIANDSYKLLNGDWFNPCLPLKFTGTYKTYKNYYGEITKVPVFKIIMRKNIDNEKIPDSISVMNQRRFNQNHLNIYGSFR